MQIDMDLARLALRALNPAWMTDADPVITRPKYGHQVGGSGYGDWKFDGSIVKRAQRVAADLPEVLSRHDADGVVVQGSSGIFMAAALQMLMPLPVMMVRKPNENAHGSKLEGRPGHTFRRLVFLDDFVSSGDTLERVREACHSAEIVAVFQHRRAEHGYLTFRHERRPTYWYE